MATQIKTLNYNLRNVTDRNPDHDFEMQEKQVQDRLRICIRHHLAQDRLRICIRHHLAISDFMTKLEEIFSFGLFLQIFSSIIAISSAGVYVVTVRGLNLTLLQREYMRLKFVGPFQVVLVFKVGSRHDNGIATNRNVLLGWTKSYNRGNIFKENKVL
ncbi:hypothetical protein QE152_g10875 [Popillia japonica]|uniref:Uncharacterized protein n=1 Tax=Popillia japonica TaxID=7064 RepID=A0AAW1LTQ4_POPJA